MIEKPSLDSSTEACDLEQLNSFINELELKNERKLAERTKNSSSDLETERQKSFRLDSNIKKSSAFVRKLKTFNESSKESILKEINSLNLNKYLSEITAALIDLKLKTSDLNAYVQVCCELHRFYADFSSLLLIQWQQMLPKQPNELTNHTKLRNDLPLFAELISYGVFSIKEALPVLGNLLKLLLNEKQSIHLNVIINFCRNCGWDYAGLVNRKMRLLAEANNKTIPRSNFLPFERQKGLRSLLKDYFQQQVHLLEQQHLALREKEHQNKQLLITKGEIPNKKKEAYEEERINFNKFFASMQTFADLLDEDLPKLESEVSQVQELSAECLQESKVNLSEIPLWEDEHMRTFYEDLPSLKNQVPASLYKESIKEKYRKPYSKKVNVSTVEKSERKENEKKSLDREPEATDAMTDEMLAEKLTKELVNGDSDDETTTIEKVIEDLQLDSDDDAKKEDKKSKLLPKTGKEEMSQKMQLELLLSSLVNCLNRETIDKAALEFILHLNTKSNRKKLIRTLFWCPRTRLDLLPFYARFTAILNPVMPLVGADLVYLLKKDFRFHLRKKDQINIESKVKNVRFIGELTKFSIFPKEEALQCLKILLLDFTHHHIEMACNLLEVCGRYLYLNVDTHHKCNLLLEQMMRKKSLMTMQPKYISMIENAYYASCPSTSSSNQNHTANDSQVFNNESNTPLTQHQQFARYLIYNKLDKRSLDQVLNLLFLYPYSDVETSNFITKCFIEVWNVKFFNIQVLANCLAVIDLYNPEIAVSVIDAILEDIRIMFDIDSIKYNQRRISVLTYLGELYNYRLIGSLVIFNTLYWLITYKVNSNYEAFYDVWLNRTMTTQQVSTNRSNSPETVSNGEADNQFENKLKQFGESESDKSENLFRIRLVCVLLDTVGIYITNASGKKRLHCFLLFFQMYYQRKRSMLIHQDGSFPIQTQHLFEDTIRKLKPKFRLAQNYEEAYEAVLELLNELAPSVTKLLPSLQPTDAKSGSKKELNSIAENEIDSEEDDDEHDDEDDEEDDEEMDEDEEDDQNESENNSDEELENEEDSSDSSDSDEDDDGSDEDEEVNDVLNASPALNEEEEEFRREFERMISESLVTREQENVRNINSDIVIPLSKLNSLNKSSSSSSFSGNSQSMLNSSFCPLSSQSNAPQDSEPKYNVILMTKGKNKPLLRKIEVPSDSQLAINLKEKERAEKEEKEMVKKLTLDINERREMEDEMSERSVSGSISLNLNRASRRKYTHLKGVPDADLIFGPTKRR